MDFESKLLPYWNTFCEIKEYFFVFNDKFHGTNYPIEETLAAIKIKHTLEVAEVYLAKHLEQEFIDLPEDQILAVIGGLPDTDSLEGLDYSILSEVIQHIQNMYHDLAKEGKLVAPDIDAKIQFNGLKSFSFWLKVKQRETWQIDDYFTRNSDFAKAALRDDLSACYAESLVSHPSIPGQEDEYLGDLRFAAILDKIAPATSVASHDRLRRDVALVIMARYFETCDIFEEPKNGAS